MTRRHRQSILNRRTDHIKLHNTADFAVNSIPALTLISTITNDVAPQRILVSGQLYTPRLGQRSKAVCWYLLIKICERTWNVLKEPTMVQSRGQRLVGPKLSPDRGPRGGYGLWIDTPDNNHSEVCTILPCQRYDVVSTFSLATFYNTIKMPILSSIWAKRYRTYTRSVCSTFENRAKLRCYSEHCAVLCQKYAQTMWYSSCRPATIKSCTLYICVLSKRSLKREKMPAF